MPLLKWESSHYLDVETGVSYTPADHAAHVAEWSDANLPWAYRNKTQFVETWPTSGVTIVPLQAGVGDFYTRLNATVNAAGGRVVVELGEGVFSFNQFRMIGPSGDPTYSFGFWHPNLQGLLGQGPDKTFVQMDANSMSQAQLDKMATFAAADFEPTQMGLIRIDGSQPSPVLLGGLTFRSADQQNLTAKGAGVAGVLPQPAPHNGVQLYGGSHACVSYVRFQAAGRAMTSAPPFECASAQTGRSTVFWNNCEFDGRRSPDLDPARPRRCGTVMVNGETLSEFTDTWFHHSNVSRYAANDQSRDYQGQYRLTRCKLDHITDNQNTDPALNNGQSLGGYTNATPLGWESTNGTIQVVDCIIDQDNSQFAGQVPCHMQLTWVGSRNPQGGRLHVSGTVCRNAGFPSIDGFITLRIKPSTYWLTDGPTTTMFVHHPVTGARLDPHVYSGSWPPVASTLAASGVTSETHYLIRHA